jgi:hypothetical protein
MVDITRMSEGYYNGGVRLPAKYRVLRLQMICGMRRAFSMLRQMRFADLVQYFR